MDAVESGDVMALERIASHCRDECSLNKAMSTAVKSGQVEVVRWLLHQGLRPQNFVELVVDACRTGRLDVVELLYQGRPDDGIPETFLDRIVLHPHSALDAAATYGHLHVVQWLHAQSFPASEAAMNGAASSGHLHILRWLHNHRTEGCTLAALENAACWGHFSVVRWLIRHRRLLSTAKAMTYAAKNGELAMMELLYDNRIEPVEWNAMVEAASRGHLDMVHFLHAHHVSPTRRYPEAVLSTAVASGHFHVTKWLHATYGFEVTRDALDRAICYGDLVCVRWLLSRWRGGVPDLDIQDSSPSLTMVQFLLEMGSVCSAKSMEYAAGTGQLAVLIKLHEFGATCSGDAILDAAQMGRVMVVQWLFANRTEGCPERAIIRGNTCWGSVLKFMVNEVDPITPLSLLEAAQRNDLAAVKWLYARGKLDLTSAIAWAKYHRELGTAQWIIYEEALTHWKCLHRVARTLNA